MSIRKTVNGEGFAVWAEDYDGDISELAAGMKFKLYTTDSNDKFGEDSEYVQTLEFDASGIIRINGVSGLEPGWYAIVEELSGAAAEVFTKSEPLYIFIGEDGRNSAKTGDKFDFNSNIYINYLNWVAAGGSVQIYTEFQNGMIWDGFKNGTNTPADWQVNEVQDITARTSYGSEYEEFVSYCAYIGAWAYSSDTYAVYSLDQAKADKLISAFNYIYDTYGSLDGWCEGLGYKYEVGTSATRVLAQFATWYFMYDDGDDWKITEIYAKDARYADINAAWQDVIAAVESGYEGSGLVSLLYLRDAKNPADAGNNQPQIIPIISDIVFDNRTKTIDPDLAEKLNNSMWTKIIKGGYSLQEPAGN